MASPLKSGRQMIDISAAPDDRPGDLKFAGSCLMPKPTIRDTLSSLWWCGVEAVRGEAAVRTTLEDDKISRPDAIIAVGKAAASMAKAALSVYGADIPTLVVTKYGHIDGLPPSIPCIEAAHPVPDENTLRAGEAILHKVSHMAANSHLLFLVSGGASSLAELPEAGHSLISVQTESRRMLAEGLDIHAMNALRKSLSRIKGGKLLAAFPGALVTTLAISDVEGDDLSVIGSGIADAPDNARFSFDPHIVASNRIARMACELAAAKQGLTVQSNEETLYADVTKLAPRIAAELRDGAAGVFIWGGEPTVVLPPDPGQGGRNQALALLLGKQISDVDGIDILVAGTDGTDGPTDAAGGFVDGNLWAPEAQPFLRGADSGRFLELADALFKTGPTGTNVMDLVVAIKR